MKIAKNGNFGKYSGFILPVAELLAISFLPENTSVEKEIKKWSRFLVDKVENKYNVYYGAIANGRLIGYIQVEVRSGLKTVEASNLAVREECKRMGIARDFFNKINDDFQTKEEIMLETVGKNIKTYIMIGFRVKSYYYNRKIKFIDCDKHVETEICDDKVDPRDLEGSRNLDRDERDEGECNDEFGDKEVVTYKCPIYWMTRPIKKRK